MNPSSSNIEQHWLQARELLGAGKAPESVPFLETAAAALHPAACFNLGCLHLFQLIETADRNRALSLIQEAAKQGHAGALYRLAIMELGKPDKQPDWQYANECLLKSAERGHPPALRSLAIHWSHGRDEALLSLGTLCLEHAAELGDMTSLVLLMHRLYDGIGCEKNALRASAINTLLLQTPLDIEPPESMTDMQYARAMQLADLSNLPEPALQNDLWLADMKIVCDSPWIAFADDVLTPEECRLVCYLGSPHLQPSVTATPDGQRAQMQLRSSFDMLFEDMLEDVSLLVIQRRMAMAVDTTPAYSEHLQLLRYQNGQEYRPHRDYLPPGMVTSLAEGGPGQRDCTVIAYLNDVDKGGETEFCDLDKKVAPKTGRILAFKNLYPDGTPDARTLHAGLPVSRGSKWIATLWIHQGVFRQ